jgi:hypothetical protein
MACSARNASLLKVKNKDVLVRFCVSVPSKKESASYHEIGSKEGYIGKTCGVLTQDCFPGKPIGLGLVLHWTGSCTFVLGKSQSS